MGEDEAQPTALNKIRGRQQKREALLWDLPHRLASHRDSGMMVAWVVGGSQEINGFVELVELVWVRSGGWNNNVKVWHNETAGCG